MNDVTEKLAEALRNACSQMEMAYDCIEAGRYDEALLHYGVMSRERNEALAAYESRKGGGVDVEAMRYDIGLLRLVAIKSEWFESEDKDNPVRINIKAFADKLARAIGDSHE